MRPLLYLAGPITGLPLDEANRWRRYVADALSVDIECVNPLRGMEQELAAYPKIPGEFGPSRPMITDRGIMQRAYFDCLRSRMVLCNMLGAGYLSPGTIMELAWAFDHRIPVVGLMETAGNPHDHPMIRESLTWRFASLEVGILQVRHVLTTAAPAARSNHTPMDEARFTSGRASHARTDG